MAVRVQVSKNRILEQVIIENDTCWVGRDEVLLHRLTNPIQCSFAERSGEDAGSDGEDSCLSPQLAMRYAIVNFLKERRHKPGYSNRFNGFIMHDLHRVDIREGECANNDYIQIREQYSVTFQLCKYAPMKR